MDSSADFDLGFEHSLDPVDNISRESALAPDGEPWKGFYKRRYKASFHDGIWGTSKGRCGVMTIVTRTPAGVRIQPAMCRNWACVPCGTMRAAWLKRQIAAQVESGFLKSFWTLTLRTSTVTAVDSYGSITASWNRLRTTLNDRHDALEYVWTRERTKRGWAHLHLLTSLELERGVLSEMWLRATGGSWVVDCQPVESERAGNYIAKYCVAQATDRPKQRDGSSSRLNVYGKSRGVVFEPFVIPGGEGALVVNMPFREAERLAAARSEWSVRGMKAAPWLEVNEEAWPAGIPLLGGKG